MKINNTDYKQPQTQAKLYCANWVNGTCLGVGFFKANVDVDGYDVGCAIDKKYAGKQCIVEEGDECPYFTSIVKVGIPEKKSIRRKNDNNARVG